MQNPDSHIRGIGCVKCGYESPNHAGHVWSDEFRDKMTRAFMERYGAPTPSSVPEIAAKIAASRREHGTCSTSGPEERMYEMLCERFGVDDVERQYNESRYPFNCDFYIKSLDLFIELNAGWFHNKHWFDDSDPADIKRLKTMQTRLESGKPSYKHAIETWTVRDVKKREMAIVNSLNYLVFWKNDLSDFEAWLNADTLVLKNVF